MSCAPGTLSISRKESAFALHHVKVTSFPASVVPGGGQTIGATEPGQVPEPGHGV